MTSTSLSLKEIYKLAYDSMISNGCNEENATALAKIVQTAERDGSHSHGLFRIPGYVKALRSGKVNGKAQPSIEKITPSVLRVKGKNCFAPIAQELGLKELVNITRQVGVGVLSLTEIHHFAALWPEVEYLAENDLVGIACTAYMPSVAPAGGKKAFFGTNPIAFAYPVPGKTPIVYDMATAAMAQGEVQIAARDGKEVPLGTGLSRNGELTEDPKKILEGVLLPFGGYKGSAIALMVELLAAGVTGESFSYEAKEKDNGDGGPPQGGQIVISLSPKLIAGDSWVEHIADFYAKLSSIDGVRIPGERRHQNRLDPSPRKINSQLVDTIRGLIK